MAHPMIKEIRDYIEAAIYEVDPQMRRHEQPFAEGSIPSTSLDRTFFLSFGSMGFVRADVDLEVTAPIELKIFSRLFNKPVENFDLGLCKALDISSMLLNQERLDQNNFIKGINSLRILSEAIESDESTARYTLEMDLIIYTRFKEN